MRRSIITKPSRSRPLLLGCLLVVIASGLASRRFPVLLPSLLGQYPGDALWALMIFLVIAFIKPTLGPGRLAMGALLISYGVEFTQLYQAAWINAIRETRLGHLILGSTFHWPDLIAYPVGVSLGLLLDRFLLTRTSASTTVRV